VNGTDSFRSKYRANFVFDQFTLNQLQSIPTSSPGEEVKVRWFHNDARYEGPNLRGDWIYLFATLIKLVEIIALWRLAAGVLCWIGSIPWIYFFICATVLQTKKLSREFRKEVDNDYSDILVGELKGDAKRLILLGAPPNFRSHLLWLIFWIAGAVISTMSLLFCYASLSKAQPKQVYTWLSFQAAWLVSRSIFFQFSPSPDTGHYPFNPPKSLSELPEDSEKKQRALNLMFALARHQAHIHPRGDHWYEEDPQKLDNLKAILKRPGHLHMPNLPTLDSTGTGKTVEIAVVGIVGDCLLSAAAWVHGLELGGIDPHTKPGIHLYDSCIVTVISPASTVPISVPSARALCCPSVPSTSTAQAEAGVSVVRQYVPRGTGPLGPAPKVLFYYWIPCADGTWLQVCSDHKRLLGKRQASVISDGDFVALLATRQLNIGKWSLEDMKKSVQASATTASILLNLVT